MTHYYSSFRRTLNQGNTEYMFISNDSDSPFILTVSDVISICESDVTLDIYKNVTEDSEGTVLSTNRSYSNASNYFKVAEGGTYSGLGDTFVNTFVPAGTKNDPGSAVGVPGENHIVKLSSGENILVEITNISTSDGLSNVIAILQEADEE